MCSVLAPRAVIGQRRTFPPLLVSGAHWSVSWPGTGHHWSDAATALIGGPLTTSLTTRTLRTIGNGAILHTKKGALIGFKYMYIFDIFTLLSKYIYTTFSRKNRSAS